MSLFPVLALPKQIGSHRGSISPGERSSTKRQVLSNFEHYQKESSQKLHESILKLPEIKRQSLEAKITTSLSPTSKLSPSNFHRVSKIQRENNALRDFINNFHLKKEGARVISSLDTLSNGTTLAIAGKVQRYFNQLEDYVHRL